MITQTHLKVIAAMTASELAYVVRGETIDGVLRVRRAIQEAVAKRRKSIPLADVPSDLVMNGAIGATMMLERWARQRAYEDMMPKILRSDPTLLTKPKQVAKRKFNYDWENYVKRASY